MASSYAESSHSNILGCYFLSQVPNILSALQRSVHAVLLGTTQFPDWLQSGVPSQSQLDSWLIDGIGKGNENTKKFDIGALLNLNFLHAGRNLFEIIKKRLGHMKLFKIINVEMIMSLKV